MSEQFKTGGDCDAWCTKCKMDLAHTIVAMVGGVPVQVICNTCGSHHKYRPPKSGGPKPPARPKRRSSASGAKERAQRARAGSTAAARGRWKELLDRQDNDAIAAARPYDVRQAYAKDELLKHSKFGLGFVLEELPPNRIRVLFEDSERLLITRHGQKPED